jgi:hypothetical protein
MITCNLMGGLGNQLFQIFATFSYAIESKKTCYFLKTETLGTGSTTKRNTYWNNLLCRMEPFLRTTQPEGKLLREKNFNYNSMLPQIMDYSTKENVCLFGFFQSYKYFESNYKIICRIIDIENQKKKVVESYAKNANFDLSLNIVSMHFRIGDYKKLQTYHPIMSYEYYKSSLSFIKTKNETISNILFFCEDVDLNDVTIIINKLQLDFPNIGFTRANNSLHDWEQMLLMSCCKHNIIANSSFSWWGAYLNSNVNKIVCYPSLWFGPDANHNTRDLCPHEWVKILAPYIIS